MEKPKVASSKKVSRRSRKSVKKEQPKEEPVVVLVEGNAPALTEPRETAHESTLILEWEKRPQLKQMTPSWAEIEQFKKDYLEWQMRMDKLLK